MLKPKSKVSSKYHWNQMWVRLRDDSPPWKFPLQLWTCETRQVKCFLNTVMGQAYNRHSHSKCEKQERKKRWWTTSKPKSAQGKCHQILMLKNNPLWFDALPFRLNGAAALPSGVLDFPASASPTKVAADTSAIITGWWGVFPPPMSF